MFSLFQFFILSRKVFYFCRFRLFSLLSYIVTPIPTLNKFYIHTYRGRKVVNPLERKIINV